MRIAVLAAVVTMAIPAAARAGSLESEMDSVAERVASYLKARKETAAVISLTGLATLEGNGLDGLKQILSERLAKRGIKTAARANLGVRGKVKPSLGAAYKLVVEVVDRDEEVQVDYDFGTNFEPRDVGRVLGIPFDLSGRGARDRGVALDQAARDPQVVVKEGRALAGRDSPFAVEVRVNGKQRAAESRDNLAFVGLALKEEYTVVLHNGSANELAVELFIDGLSAFHFSELRDPKDETRPQSRYFIVPAESTHEVVGYYFTGTRAKGFAVTPLEDSLAAKLGQYAKIGTITADFHNCWPTGEKPPADEPSQAPSPKLELVTETIKDKKGLEFKVTRLEELKTVGRPIIGVGTTFGSDRATDSRRVDRDVGETKASVTIRYERKKD